MESSLIRVEPRIISSLTLCCVRDVFRLVEIAVIRIVAGHLRLSEQSSRSDRNLSATTISDDFTSESKKKEVILNGIIKIREGGTAGY